MSKKRLDRRKACDTLFANRRKGQDKGIGKLSCKNATLVDYLLCSTILFPFIVDFEICEYCPLCSKRWILH